MRLLLVEDDAMIGEAIRTGLKRDGFTVDWVYDGESADRVLRTEEFDLALLDLGLPRKDGLQVLQALRARHQGLPVLIITARDAVSDRIQGLDAGADDYLVKPFDLEELLARLRALLRRTRQGEAGGPPDESLTFADLRLDPGTREVTRGERPIRLTRTEFALLELLMCHPRQVLGRDRILELVWGYDFPTTANSLEVYIGYIRRKTEAHGEPRLIHTVRGVGYALRETPP